MGKYSVQDLADMINRDCQERRYFWACGLVRETAKTWTGPYYAMLCPEAQSMADHYQETANRPAVTDRP